MLICVLPILGKVVKPIATPLLLLQHTRLPLLRPPLDLDAMYSRAAVNLVDRSAAE